MTKELLFEIRTEEIPAGYIPGALKSFRENAEKLLTEKRIGFGNIHTYGTPRRLVLQIEDVSATQKSLESKIWGPPKKIAFDADGKPGKAALGFLKKTGAELKDLKVEETGKGEYLLFVKFEKGQKSKKILKDIVPHIVSGIRFPKYMRWGAGECKFVRPVQGVSILFDRVVVPCVVLGVKSSNVSIGHPFMAPREFTFTDFKTYKKKLTSRYVILDGSQRKFEILKESKKLASKCKGTLFEDAELLETLSYLTEYPVPVLGSFEKEYLKLPRELLIEVMKKHQKYLAIADQKGKLLPNFIAVSDNQVVNNKVLRNGFEKVLRARLSDAKYFYQDDSKQPLEKYTEGFSKVVWLKEVGTLEEKVKRVVSLSAHLAEMVSPDSKSDAVRAAQLCKADLMTSMVYEFPELQGVMGRYYALASGENKGVSEAICEHYLPRFSGDTLPKKVTSAIVSVADKIDSITGCFSAGLIPSGSEDPLALRRQSLGVMNIIIEKKWNISLAKLLDFAFELQPVKTDKASTLKRMNDFFKGRLTNQLVGNGVAYDAVDAVFTVSFDNLLDDVKKVLAFSDVKQKSYFAALASTFRRVSNIIDGKTLPAPESALFKEEAERRLFEEVQSLQRISIEFIEKKDYKSALRKIVGIREFVDTLFDEVLVMDKDEKIKNNRLGLLSEVNSLFRGLADFSKIVLK